MKRRHPVASFIVCITLVLSHPALAQFSQQGMKLVAVGAIGNAHQGFSVALSGGGYTAIIGGINDNSRAGAAWIWTRSGGIWSEQVELVASDAIGTAEQGYSVAVSTDGLTAIVGGPGDDASTGAVWVWARAGGDWTQQSKLIGTDSIGRAQEGTSIALSADGSTAIIGGPADNNFAGAAWVWTRSGGIWNRQQKLVGSGALGAAEQGISVSLSADGNTAIVGGSFDNNKAGAVWVWTRSGGVWTQAAKLVASDAIGAADQGYSVALSADGNTATVGGPDDNNFAGAAWVWTQGGGVWTESTKLIGSGAVGNAQQGSSVAVSNDGARAIVGGPADNGYAGAAWAWAGSGTVWTQQSTKLVGSGTAGNAEQGGSVALSPDGSTAILGGYFDDAEMGAAWVFTAPPETCTQTSTTLCLNEGRFAVSAAWRTGDGQSGRGQAVPLTTDTGYFTFFSATNVEVVIKVLNACGLNSKYWVFAGGLTDVNVVLTVRDTLLGDVRTYTNPQGTAFQPIQDTDAFTTCNVILDPLTTPFVAPHPSAQPPIATMPARPVPGGACAQDATTICLNDNRFAVNATWRTGDGKSGQGQAVRVTADTGYFTFFSASNVEVVIKVLNACSLNSTYWVFAGGLTNVNVVLTVRDTLTGVVRTYTNPLDTAFQPIQDTSALATCGASAPAGR
jgi:FG-GAP repeat